MILYKYVGLTGGIEIIRTNTIGFRQPIYLNDPTELSAAYPRNDYHDANDFIEMSNRRSLKDFIWRTKYGILSLTRSANNPLMWSHYSEGHKGFVIGFKVTHDFFSSKDVNLVPVQFGNVIYTSTKPIHSFIDKSDHVIKVGSEISYLPERLESLQRIFLYKPLCWSYEEEVRIVRNISMKKQSNREKIDEVRIIKANDNDLYVYNLPKNTIKEIYLGYDSPLLQNQHVQLKRLMEQTAIHNPEAVFNMCFPDEFSWEFIYKKL